MFWKKVRESLSRLSINGFKLATNNMLAIIATNNMLGYDIPRVKLKMICTARFGRIQGGGIGYV